MSMHCILPPPVSIQLKTIVPQRAVLSRVVFLWMCLLLLFSPLFAHADTSMYTVTATCGQLGSTSPYLSGTLCVAGGGFTLNGPSTVTVTYMYLYVAGTLVRSVTFDQRSINQTNDGLSATFDSTHFNDGATVKVEFDVWFSDGSSITKTASSSAYNKAYIYGNQVPPDGIGSLNFGKAAVTAVSTQLGSTNHTILPGAGNLTRLKADILTDIPTTTVFYTWTHGNAIKFGDSSSFGMPDPQKDIAAVDVTNAVANKTPAQPPNLPPYNCVFRCL